MYVLGLRDFTWRKVEYTSEMGAPPRARWHHSATAAEKSKIVCEFDDAIILLFTLYNVPVLCGVIPLVTSEAALFQLTL